MGRIIGIDFGTTNSVASFVNSRGNIEIIKDHNGDYLMPSVVAKYDDKLIVGKEAKENEIAFINGDGVSEVKRKIGKNEKILFDGKYVEPKDIAAIIIGKLKGNAEAFLKETVTDAVITVPAEFSDMQRKEIIEAATMAGLNVKKIINEPTAALLNYTQNNISSKKILCYDFGGGTFDVSIADVNVNRDVSVIAAGGDRELGGKDIDKVFFKYLLNDLQKTKNIKLDAFGKRALLLAVEKAKIDLSSKTQVTISIEKLSTTSGTIGCFKTIYKNEFERLIYPIIQNTINLVNDTLDDTNINPRSIDEVVLVGGSSKIPLVSEKLREIFGNKVKCSDDMDMCVSMGAAIEAANQIGQNYGKKSSIKKDVCPFNLGLKVWRDGNDDVFDSIVNKNSAYGVQYSEKYNTAMDNQVSMVLEIYQGDSGWASENEHICDFEIKGIPMNPAGEEWVRVSFQYDENGIINIKAKILSTGVEFKHSYKYGYDISNVDTSFVDEHLICSEDREKANKIKEELQEDGIWDIASEIDEYVKYEQKEDLEGLLQELEI